MVRTEDFSGSNSSACDKSDYFIEPVTLLPNIIEFNYYASALGPLFAADAIVGKFDSSDTVHFKKCTKVIIILTFPISSLLLTFGTYM